MDAGIDDTGPLGTPSSVTTLARNWWAIALRGVAAVLFGILTFIVPGATIAALVLLFGVYSLVDGALYIAAALRRHGTDGHWGMLLLAGIAGIVVGVLTFWRPGMTAIVLLYFVAVWALVTGGAEIAAAIRLRKVVRGEWLLALAFRLKGHHDAGAARA